MFVRLTCFAFVLATVVHAVADDWPQWRGANRDAVLSPSEQIDELPTGKVIPRKWSVPIGSGYSGPTVADGRVYLTDRGEADISDEVERILCFDAETGQEVWRQEYEAKYTIGYRAGPRASVTVEDSVAYVVGAMGHFHCLDAITGEVIWKRDLGTDYDVRMPVWGITTSPLIYHDLVIQVAAGKGDACLVALDKKTGAERWRALDERAQYSAPIVIQQGDHDVVVCWTGESVSGLNPLDGSVYWSIEMLPRNMPIGVPTPIVKDNLLFVSCKRSRVVADL